MYADDANGAPSSDAAMEDVDVEDKDVRAPAKRGRMDVDVAGPSNGNGRNGRGGGGGAPASRTTRASALLLQACVPVGWVLEVKVNEVVQQAAPARLYQLVRQTWAGVRHEMDGTLRLTALPRYPREWDGLRAHLAPPG